MKKENKNAKLIKDACDSFMEKQDSLFALFDCGKGKPNEQGIACTGNFEKIEEAFTHVILEALKGGDSDEAKTFQDCLSAIFNAMFKVLNIRDNRSIALMGMMNEMLEASMKLLDEEEEAHAYNDFDPMDKDCLKCEDYADCLMKHIAKVRPDIKRELDKREKKTRRRNEGKEAYIVRKRF